MGHAERMDPAPASRDRTLIGILSAIAVLVVVALVVVFGRGAPEQLDPETPEGVVQRYSAAAIDGDEVAAAEFLTPDAREDCDRVSGEVADSIRVTLLGTEQRDDSADVRVSIITTYGDGGPFGPSESQTDGVFDLVRQDGDWLIDRAPWQLIVCSGTEVSR